MGYFEYQMPVPESRPRRGESGRVGLFALRWWVGEANIGALSVRAVTVRKAKCDSGGIEQKDLRSDAIIRCVRSEAFFALRVSTCKSDVQ